MVPPCSPHHLPSLDRAARPLGRLDCTEPSAISPALPVSLSAPPCYPYPMPPADLLTDLRSLIPEDRLLTDPAELFVYESDGFTIAKARPAAVVFATSTEEVQDLVKLIARHGAQ